jgi:AbrB family looped-hinge helix DNA binding protein
MVEIIAKVSSKNQVTLPVDVRRRLGIAASDRIAFVIGDNDKVELRRVKFDLESILGSLDPLPNESIDLDREIAEAIEAEMARRSRERA